MTISISNCTKIQELYKFPTRGKIKSLFSISSEEGDEHQDPTYIETDSDEKPFKLLTKKKSGSDVLFIEENLNDDDSMPNIIIKGDNSSINVNINYNNAL
ncbi:19869_t:CDS:2 [Entrophospora sp. SA101]|nr:19865_t:CDS:2 [Entrophospora sp. SA101]CAJ0746583.1 19869_t:CDS:2 [Entrophospora sp. SA101]